MKFFTQFDRPKKSIREFDQSKEVSMTRQSEADEADINKIMERFDRTGKLPIMQQVPPQYGDARIVDFQTAQQIISDAKSQFMELPANVRKHFANDPQLYFEALTSPKAEDAQKLLELGVIKIREKSEKELLQEISDKVSIKPSEQVKA